MPHRDPDHPAERSGWDAGADAQGDYRRIHGSNAIQDAAAEVSRNNPRYITNYYRRMYERVLSDLRSRPQRQPGDEEDIQYLEEAIALQHRGGERTEQLLAEEHDRQMQAAYNPRTGRHERVLPISKMPGTGPGWKSATRPQRSQEEVRRSFNAEHGITGGLWSNMMRHSQEDRTKGTAFPDTIPMQPQNGSQQTANNNASGEADAADENNEQAQAA